MFKRTKKNENIATRISQKYTLESNENDLTEAEKKDLKGLDDKFYDPVVESLRWKVVHSSVCNEFEEFKAGNLQQMSNNLTFLTTKEIVPESTRQVAKDWLNLILDDIEKNYNDSTRPVSLSRCEYQVIQYLCPSRDYKDYGETTIALHWKVTAREIDKDLERLDSDPNSIVKTLGSLNFIILNYRVPHFLNAKAKRLWQKIVDVTTENIDNKYNLDSLIDELTDAEVNALEKLDVVRNTYSPVVVRLHWMVTHSILCEELENFLAGRMNIDMKIHSKLNFLSQNEKVPAMIKKKAKEFMEEISKRNLAAST